MRRRIAAGNWKMNMGLEASAELARKVKDFTGSNARSVDIVVCPTFLSLADVAEELEGSGIAVGAQDCYHGSQGAFTGEVNPELIKDAGGAYCIVGHSERRTLMQEADKEVNLKAKALIGAGIVPIICVGETLAERQALDTMNVVRGQVMRAYAGIAPEDAAGTVIAYEPVWAIGTGLNATADDAEAVCKAIRDVIRYIYDGPTADSVRILYGGSVKADNISGLMSEKDIDGALVGGASLKAAEFGKIVQAIAGKCSDEA
ncbi:MAG: Triosephosphate isomerase [Firmicutes bacterium ADurb.Bin153]|nr:MAG: Triosephosphate isomerase [Firmicutes bacterium ADurb.Bin153]